MSLECTACGDRLPSGPDAFDVRVDHAIDEHGVEDLDEYRELYRPGPDPRVPA